MTGKEAIRVVADMSIYDVRRLRDETPSATIKRVCVWRIDEPLAFEELAVYANARPIAIAPSANIPSDAIADAFSTWATANDVAKALGKSRTFVLRAIERVVLRGYVRERRSGEFGLEYRLTPRAKETAA